MKQVLQSYKTGELWLADVPAPAPQRGHVVVQTHASLISAGTERGILEVAKKSLIGKALARPDQVKRVIQKIRNEGLFRTLEQVEAKLSTPFALGYSCVGTVVATGAGVDEFRIGDRLACAGFGVATHAEFNAVPVNLCAPVAAGIPDAGAACATLGAIALQGVRQADVRLGETVLVVGLGLLGLITVQLLAASGCRVLGSDPVPARCELAKKLGALEATNSAAADLAASYTAGHGADAVIITASTESTGPLEAACDAVRAKGLVVIVGRVGMTVPYKSSYNKEIEFRMSMSYGPGRYDTAYEVYGHDYPRSYVRWTENRNMRAFLDCLASGSVRMDPLISHQFQIDQALEAYQLLMNPKAISLGILLNYPRPEAGVVQPLVNTQTRRAIRSEAQVRLGIIGVGNFARSTLIPALKKAGSFELVGVATSRGISASDAGKALDAALVTTNYRELLARPEVNAVVIATRHREHAEMTSEALAAGKHVFVEKPLALDAAGLRQVEEAWTKSDRGLMVGFNRRYSEASQLVKQHFKGIAPLTLTARINAGQLSAESWIGVQEEGGQFNSEAGHFIDLLTYWAGGELERSEIFRANAAGKGDAVQMILVYSNGSVGCLHYTSFGDRATPKEYYEVFGGGRVAQLDDFRTLHLYRDGKVDTRKFSQQDKGHRAELETFLKLIRDGGEMPVSFAELVRTTRASLPGTNLDESPETGNGEIPSAAADNGSSTPGEHVADGIGEVL